MDATFEQAVREGAYALWVEAGRIHGLDRAHWLAAETAMKGTKVVEHAALEPAAKPASRSVTAKSTANKPTVTKVAAKTGIAKAATSAKVAAKAIGRPRTSRAAPTAPSHPAT